MKKSTETKLLLLQDHILGKIVQKHLKAEHIKRLIEFLEEIYKGVVRLEKEEEDNK